MKNNTLLSCLFMLSIFVANANTISNPNSVSDSQLIKSSLELTCDDTNLNLPSTNTLSSKSTTASKFMFAHYGYVVLQLSTSGYTFNTELYFNSSASRGLDPGYDAAVFGSYQPDVSICSYLVDSTDNTGYSIQSLSDSDMYNVIVPLGINAHQGEEVVISIAATDVPDNVDIYLEDRSNNTFTQIRNNDYSFIAEDELSGSGRFFISFESTTLSVEESINNELSVKFNNSNKTISIAGELNNEVEARLYDTNGKLLLTKNLNKSTSSNYLDVNNLSTGVYIVELLSKNNYKQATKVIIK